MPLLTISPSHIEEEADGPRAPLLIADTLRWYQRTMAGHAQRTAWLAIALAHGLRRSEQETRFIGLAALLHDIGKLAIPAAILNNPGPLTEQE